MYGARIVGIGVALPGTNIPGRIVTNDELAKELKERRDRLVHQHQLLSPDDWGKIPETERAEHEAAWKQFETDDEWIVSHTGIRERRFADSSVATSDLATTAGRMAMAMAGWEPTDVEAVLVATVTPDFPTTPPTAAIVQENLGIPPNDENGSREIEGFDITCACSSFGRVLKIAYILIRSGFAERVLVTGADVMSRTSNSNHHSIYPILADAGNALALERVALEDDAFLGPAGFRAGLDGSLANLIVTEYGGSRNPIETPEIFANPLRMPHRMVMEGGAVKKKVERLLLGHKAPGIIDQALHKAGLSINQIDALVLHQANARINGPIVEKLRARGFRGLAPQNIWHFGNTTSASIGILLYEAWVKGLLKEDKLVLSVVFGGGLSWATGIFRWTLPISSAPNDLTVH